MTQDRYKHSPLGWLHRPEERLGRTLFHPRGQHSNLAVIPLHLPVAFVVEMNFVKVAADRMIASSFESQIKRPVAEFQFASV